jgi:hypothetical protein
MPLLLSARGASFHTNAMKKPLLSSARGASFHTKHVSNANVVRVVLLDANSYLALSSCEHAEISPCMRVRFFTHKYSFETATFYQNDLAMTNTQ